MPRPTLSADPPTLAVRTGRLSPINRREYFQAPRLLGSQLRLATRVFDPGWFKPGQAQHERGYLKRHFLARRK
jgi:hypothetical protein